MANTPSVEAFIAKQPMYNRRRKWLHVGLRGLMSLLCKLEVRGTENIPPQGGTILMMNHISAIDPPIITTAVKNRFVTSMAKIETLENSFMRFIIGLWGNFVVNRGEVDRVALGIAIELIRCGQLLMIAPEGTRNRGGLKQPKDGIAYIAQKADAVIVPSAVLGVAQWRENLKRLSRSKALVNFGKPFRFRIPDGERLSKEHRAYMMQEAMYQLALAIPEEYAEFRGDYQDVQKATTRYLAFV